MTARFRGRMVGALILCVLAVVSWFVSKADQRFIGDWFVNLTAPAQTLFVVWYSLLHPWRYPGPGRAVWIKAVALAILLDVILLARRWPTLPHLQFITAFGEVLIVLGIYWQLGAFAQQRWIIRQEDRTSELLETTYDSKDTDG